MEITFCQRTSHNPMIMKSRVYGICSKITWPLVQHNINNAKHYGEYIFFDIEFQLETLTETGY